MRRGAGASESAQRCMAAGASMGIEILGSLGIIFEFRCSFWILVGKKFLNVVSRGIRVLEESSDLISR